MSRTLNVRARDFSFQHLFLADPEQYGPASVALRELATEFCARGNCDLDAPCRRHAQAVMVGVAKMIASGEVFAEMSSRGVVFVRLSPAGVMAPRGWSSVPVWFGSRPDLVEWARSVADRKRWEAKV